MLGQLFIPYLSNNLIVNPCRVFAIIGCKYMYVVTKYVVLSVLKRAIETNNYTVDANIIENILVRDLPIHANLVANANPSQVIGEIKLVLEELNEILLEGLENSSISRDKKEKIKMKIKKEGCISYRNEQITINKICEIPLKRLLEFVLKQFNELIKKSDVSLTGSYISLIKPFTNKVLETMIDKRIPIKNNTGMPVIT